jgi:hypothetical protein
MASVVNINDVLEGHGALDIECVDRLLLNAYPPTFQVGGQVVRFLCGHLGYEIPSTGLMGRIGTRFRATVRAFAAQGGIPILALGTADRTRWDDRKLDRARPHFERAEGEGRFVVVAIVSCQEFHWVLRARNRSTKPGIASRTSSRSAAGFTDKSLRGLVARLLGQDYGTTKMSYDLKRLRLNGLIQRLPRSSTYVLTPEDIRVAVFYTNCKTASCARSWTPTNPSKDRDPPRPRDSRIRGRPMRPKRPTYPRRIKSSQPCKSQPPSRTRC